jgi:hypothetical protein
MKRGGGEEGKKESSHVNHVSAICSAKSQIIIRRDERNTDMIRP